MVLVDVMILLFIFAHAGLQTPALPRARLTRALLWMGTLSYGIYAWHAYLMSNIKQLSTEWVALLFASAAIAYLSYRWVELPALKLKRWSRTPQTVDKLS